MDAGDVGAKPLTTHPPFCCGDHVEGSTVCGHYQTHQRPPHRLHEPCATQGGTHSDLLGTHRGVSPASQYTGPPSACVSALFVKKKKKKKNKPPTWLVFQQLSSQAGGHWAGRLVGTGLVPASLPPCMIRQVRSPSRGPSPEGRPMGEGLDELRNQTGTL